MTSDQAVLVVLVRGVAVWIGNGKLVYSIEIGDMSPDGLTWLKEHKDEIVKGLHPAREGKLEREIRAGMGPEWMKLYRMERDCLKKEVPEIGLQELRLRTWARVLGQGPPLSWPAEDMGLQNAA